MPAYDPFSTKVVAVDQPIRRAVAVTPHDTNDLAIVCRSLYVGGQGNVNVILADDTVAVVHVAMVGWNPMMVKRVLATDTTATGIVAHY